MALIVKADGTTEERKFNRKNCLPELQAAVGGFVEFAPVFGSPYQEVMLNEEGKLKSLPVNQVATQMAGWMGRDYICGTAVFFKTKELPL